MGTDTGGGVAEATLTANCLLGMEESLRSVEGLAGPTLDYVGGETTGPA